ncbi:MAG: transcription termination/antitermination protein NusG [Candidatus Zophobacter franzmannii]|nr:transcription termination/antitermination protein NusG [Candidatus Zophobacter franzmannii]
MKWYVVHTYYSHENRVKQTIEKGILNTPLEGQIGQILVPVQKTFHIRDGKKIEREKKLFNSYIIIEADLVAEVKNYILNISGVTHILGYGKNPIPLPKDEVDRLLGIENRDQGNSSTHEILPGDHINIVAGPFTEFDGVVDKLDKDGLRLTVNVSVFGRITPVEVSADQVEIKK